MPITSSKRFLRGIVLSTYTETKNTPKNIGIIFIIFIPIFIYIWIYIQTVKIDYRINELKKDEEKLKVENEQLIAKYQAIISIDKIEQIACEKYGFKHPSPEQIKIITKNDNLIKKVFLYR